MRIITNILPSINLTARLSCNTSNRRYTSLVEIVPRKYLTCRNLVATRICEHNAKSKEVIKENNGPFKKTRGNPFLSIAPADLNSISKNSHKVFLIPLDILRANEHFMRNTITSIYSYTQKIDKFCPALKNVKVYGKKETKDLKSSQSDQKSNPNESQLVKYKHFRNTFAANTDYLDMLAGALNKSFNQIFGIRAHVKLIKLVENENSNLSLSFSPLKKKGITLNQNMTFSQIKGFLTKHIPMTLDKKSFSTATPALRINNFSDGKSFDFQTLSTQPKSYFQTAVTTTTKRNSSSSSSRFKSNPNHDFPYLSKIFGTEALLMRSDAYNQALIEAAKRRAALEECQSVSQKFTNDDFNRPQVISLKESSVPKLDIQYALKSELKPFKPCTAPSIPKKQADSGCKKNDPCKPQCPDPCKNELEKLEKEQSMRKKKNKMPTGCESPKCKKNNKCNKSPKNPCKKASSEKQIQIGEVNQFSKLEAAPIEQIKQITLKSKRLSNEEMIRAVIKKSEECVCSACKKGGKNKGKSTGKPKPKTKEDTCKDDKEYKPKCNTDSCKEKPTCGGGKKAMNVQAKMDEKKADPCKKKDPCGKKDDPCAKKKDPCAKKKDPCGKKEDPCGKKKDPCGKKEDPCGKKKDPCGKKEDPCGKKKDSCGKKEDPCKKKDPCAKKKDPCGKKEDPCGKKKDPCAKKKDPCGKKEDPCKKKPTSPCKPKKCASSQKSSSGCGESKGETKPNCKNIKSFSTNTTVAIPSCDVMVKRTLTNLPSLNYWNLYSFGFRRQFSSKKKKSEKDLGKSSQCKSVQTHVPPQRKNAYNPHPKTGLRQCYPTYDMECKKLCKDPRKTDCKRYAFLKDTNDKKRKSKK